MAPCRFASAPTLLFASALAACAGERGLEPTAVEVVSGSDQRAVQGLSLEDPIVVRVLSELGDPVSGYAISAEPAPGHGRTDSVTVTDGDGVAEVYWTLGTEAGEHTNTVTAGEASTTVSATALDLEAELDTLFVPATDGEIETTAAEWTTRDYSAAEVAVELTGTISLGGTTAVLRIVSHEVDGVLHYGAIAVPEGADTGSLHLLAYLHGGDAGVSVTDLQYFGIALGDLTESFAFVVPAFRSEELRYGNRGWISEGPSSPWDRDVDDAIALVNVAFETTPELKAGGYSAIGGSRGAGVALLAGARDERLERILAFFGPTDFFDGWVRDIVRDMALRTPPSLPGVAHLDSTLVQPFIRGNMARAEARLDMVRRSAVLYASELPMVQIHHGTLDEVVDVSQAYSLIAAMEELGREPPDFEAFIYEGGGHDIFFLEEAIERGVEFISGVLDD